MLTYIIRRLLLMFPTLIGILAVVFFVVANSPGGIGVEMVNKNAEMDPKLRKAMIAYYNERYGLDQPQIVQFGRWLNRISPLGFGSKPHSGEVNFQKFGFKVPDLGESFFRRRPVLDLFIEALPITFLLNIITTPIIYGVSILAGIYMARYRGRFFDVSIGYLFLALWSIPAIWVGVMLIGFLANKDYVRLFPTNGLSSTLADQMPYLPQMQAATDAAGQPTTRFEPGWLLDRSWHLILPLICMTYGGFAYLSKLMRASTLENISADFVRTARAKGVNERFVLLRHVFRNSMLPLITVAADILPGLLGGSLVIETLFSIPGMGKLFVDAVFARDRELIMAEALIGGLIGLLCLLVADLCYAVADPRVSYE